MARGKTAVSTPIVPFLKGEDVAFGDHLERPKATDEELNQRYVRGEIRIVTESARYPLTGIKAMLKEEVTTEAGTKEPRYLLDPEYQRRHRWDPGRRSRLIESFLMNVPVPPVFLYERDLARFEVMDGRQRLTALADFFDNKLELTGLEHWPDLDGRRYDTLPEKVRDGIDRRYISSIILLKETASDPQKAARLKKMVFERLNSGGVRLSPQETRNAVYNGPMNQLCLRLSAEESFRALWGISESPEIGGDPESASDGVIGEEDDSSIDEPTQSTRAGRKMYERMEDVELVLRFFAYRHLAKFPLGLNKIGYLLDQYLIKANEFDASVIEQLGQKFRSTISFLTALLGAHPFCRLTAKGEPKGRATKIVFDPLMYIASLYADAPARPVLLARGDAVRQRLGTMYEKNDKLFSGRSTNASDSQERNKKMHDVFKKAAAATI